MLNIISGNRFASKGLLANAILNGQVSAPVVASDRKEFARIEKNFVPRAVSNLRVDPGLRLPKAQMSAGFMNLYTARHKLGAKLYASIIYQSWLPATRVPGFFDDYKEDAFMLMMGIPSNAGASVLTKVMDLGKEGYRFVVRAGTINNPNLLQRQRDIVNSYCGLNEAQKVTEAVKLPKEIDGRSFIGNLLIPNNIKTHLYRCLEKITFTGGEDLVEIHLHFFISKAEAEHLTSTTFLAIRPGNLYALLVQWVNTSCGRKGRLPVASIPISAISTMVSKAMTGATAEPRNKNLGIVALETGKLVWIPESNSALQYEQDLDDYGLQADGSFTFAKRNSGNFTIQPDKATDGTSTEKKLPKNMPVFTDWVNNKFAYSNTMGFINVLDLTRCVALRNFHVREYFEEAATTGVFVLNSALRAAKTVDASLKLAPSKEELAPLQLNRDQLGKFEAATDDMSKYVEMVTARIQQMGLYSDFLLTMSDVKVYHFAEDSPVLPLRCIQRLVRKIKKVFDDHMENIFQTYSVKHTIELKPYLIIAVNLDKYPAVAEKDTKQRKVYTEQGVDPAWEPDGVPFARKDMAFMPHQARGDNMMRASPNYGIWAVDAGGGKSLSILTHVLKEIQRGKSKLPIILCPPHLIANYIKEAVFLTEGRVNVLAITSYTVKQNGFARLEKMIMNAPINTIFLTDYDFLNKSNKQKIAYGTYPTVVFNNVEFLRKFKFDLAVMDESHFLKNDSIRAESAQVFLSEIPMKRLASGTFVHDTPLDIVQQFALLDPTVFGGEEAFKERYAEVVKGGKVISWLPKAEKMMQQRMREHCVYVEAHRKEWASLLPTPVFNFWGVKLTENQRAAYQDLLEKTIARIQAIAAEDSPRGRRLKKAIEAAKTSDDDSVIEKLGAALKPYLSRLEQFLSAPHKDELGALFVDQDAQSPKVVKIIELCKEHLSKKLPGKILIFTNHVKVAEAIYEGLPADLKAMTIHYKAANKMEAASQFERDNDMQIMVGVEKSMNTGLNLQFAGRLIRCETVWTPGEMEQGNARLFRPNLKDEEGRSHVYYDWILTNDSFDITKASRLIGKIIQKSKFDESEDPRYDALPKLDMIPMTLDNIKGANNWNILEPYLMGFKEYQNLLFTDYAAFKAKMGNKPLKEFLVPVKASGLLQGSALMSRVPYVPDMDIYATDQLGLVRYDEYMRLDPADLGEEDEEDTDDDDGLALPGEDDEAGGDETTEDGVMTQREKNRLELSKIFGTAVHCEHGDGTIVGINKRDVVIELNSGERVTVRKIATFVISRRDTNTKDIRNQLMKAAGDLPIDAPIDVPADALRSGKGVKINKKIAQELVKNQEIHANLYWTVVNGFLGLGYRKADSDAVTVSALAQFGFRALPQHFIAHMPNSRVMLAQFKIWHDKGFEINVSVSQKLKMLFQNYTNPNAKEVYNIVNTVKLKNFFVMTFKGSNDPMQIKPFPLIRDGKVYLMMPSKAQIGTQQGMKYKAPGVVWARDAEDEYIRFVPNRKAALAVIKQLLDAGVKIDNMDDLGAGYKKLQGVVERAEGEKDDEEE